MYKQYEELDTRQLMADMKFYEAYSRWIPEFNRYETWEEAVHRVMDMHRNHLSDVMTEELGDIINEIEQGYKEKLFLGAQRALQFGGDQLSKHNARMYNCAATYADRPNVFNEIMYLMLCGAGVGFSVQKQHIEKLPTISSRSSEVIIHTIEDSIEGWSDAIGILLSSYFTSNQSHPSVYNKTVHFVYDDIRPKGAFISGGFKAPGPEPLKNAIEHIEKLLNKSTKSGTTKLKPIEVYDIIMYCADAVIAGGVRRSATICIFSPDDEEMLTAKMGNWFQDNKQRGRSNNSVMLIRDETTYDEFKKIIENTKHFGEPGFIFSDSKEFVFNPCVEIGMKPVTTDGETGFQFCNLTEINGALSTSEEVFYKQCRLAAALGTIQASYTDFKYVSSATKKITEREALIGVGITGVMNNPKILLHTKNVLKAGAEIVKMTNKKIAGLIGINQAARTTCIKPSGNASVLLGSSSGIHAEHSKRYIRHVQMNNGSEVLQNIKTTNQYMVEQSVWSTGGTDSVIAFPIIVKDGSYTKIDVSDLQQLEIIAYVQAEWVNNGTNKELCVDDRLRHNVSNTVTVSDWDAVAKYIYDNRNFFCGVSMLAASGDKAYPQAPNTEVLQHTEIIEKYGEVALFTSALIEAGTSAFNEDLWKACATALGYGEVLDSSHKNLSKNDFVRRFNKFASNFDSKEECANCLKDVYNLHKWWRITNNFKSIDISMLSPKQYSQIDADTLGAQGCAGGKCEVV